jgi:hypothetical protein
MQGSRRRLVGLGSGRFGRDHMCTRKVLEVLRHPWRENLQVLHAG